MRKALYVILILFVVFLSAFFIIRAWLQQGEITAYQKIRIIGEDEIIIQTQPPDKKLIITLNSPTDYFRALGFAQAMAVGDRMTFLRLCTRGELSPYFGSDYADIDVYLKQWHFRDLASETIAALNDETEGILEKYIQGINQRFSEMPPPSGCRWYSVNTDPWLPEDILAIWHLLRWSQLDRWPLTIFTQATEIYYGQQVKKHFEIVLGTSVSGTITGDYLQDFITLYALDKKVRDIVGLAPGLQDHAIQGIPLFTYQGGENENWLDCEIHLDSLTWRSIQFAGLPISFFNTNEYAVPVQCHVVPVEIKASLLHQKTLSEKDELVIKSETMNSQLYVPLSQFDRDGRVFSHLLLEEAWDTTVLNLFSYVSATVNNSLSMPPMIKGNAEQALCREIQKHYATDSLLLELSKTNDPALWGLFVVTLLNKVYQDDLDVIHPIFSEWQKAYPGFFLNHLLLVMKNPYSSWWDLRETPTYVENMDDIFYTISQQVMKQKKRGDMHIHILEKTGHPLGRFHLLTGSYRYVPKTITLPLFIRQENGSYLYNTFVYVPL